MIPFLPLKAITEKYAAEIHEAVRRVVDSGWYLQGKENEQFEQHYASYIGTDYCVGVGNGLDALIWIYRAYIELGVMKPGDEVIVPANTFIASILAITENGLKPVFVEPRLDTLEIDDEQIEAAITDRTRSILLVHLYGRCAYTEKIAALCKQYNLKLVEDNAQAQGCRCFAPMDNGQLTIDNSLQAKRCAITQLTMIILLLIISLPQAKPIVNYQLSIVNYAKGVLVRLAPLLVTASIPARISVPLAMPVQ